VDLEQRFEEETGKKVYIQKSAGKHHELIKTVSPEFVKYLKDKIYDQEVVKIVKVSPSQLFKVAFDVDGTLIYQIGPNEDTPRYDVISLLYRLKDFGCQIYVWSGSGIDYTHRWCQKLGLTEVIVIDKGVIKPDLAVDDEIINLGVINLRV